MLKNYKNFKGGFTLIELLVVIAIIGILASVILASLGTARKGAADAKTEAQLASVRSAAELYYGTGNTYGTAANCLAGMFIDTTSGMKALIEGTPNAVCQSADQLWAVHAPLVAPTGSSWCVDSSGASRKIATPAGSVTVCP